MGTSGWRAAGLARGHTSCGSAGPPPRRASPGLTTKPGGTTQSLATTYAA
jgi:hypothetical protein